MTEWTFKILPKIFTILPNWRIFAKSGHSGIGLSRCSTCIKTFTTCSKVQVNRIACQCHPSRLTKYVLAKWVVSSNGTCKVVVNKCTIFGWHWRKKTSGMPFGSVDRNFSETLILWNLFGGRRSWFSSLLKLLFFTNFVPKCKSLQWLVIWSVKSWVQFQFKLIIFMKRRYQCPTSTSIYDIIEKQKMNRTWDDYRLKNW